VTRSKRIFHLTEMRPLRKHLGIPLQRLFPRGASKKKKKERRSGALRAASAILLESVEGDDMKFPLSSRLYRFVSCFPPLPRRALSHSPCTVSKISSARETCIQVSSLLHFLRNRPQATSRIVD